MRILSTLLLLLATAVGCRLPGMEGPVSRALATSRQFSHRGMAALEQGRWPEAEKYLADAVEACPADADARRYHAEALWHRQRRDEALAELGKAIELSPDDAALQVRAAEMYLSLGQRETAGQHAQQALDLNPQLASGWAIRARVHQARGDAPQALADYYRALALEPEELAIQREVAELCLVLDRPQQALTVIHHLVDSYTPDEEPQEILYLQGMALAMLERPGDAAASFAAAAYRGKPSPELLYRLADAQWRDGRHGDALAAAQEALRLDPAHQPSRELLGRLELAARNRR